MTTDTNSTPIVKTTALRAYPGWEIHHRPDNGAYWAVDTTGTAISPAERSFADALYFVKHGEPKWTVGQP